MTKILGLMTGIALLASIGVANAREPVVMIDTQLDRITAGVADSYVWADGKGVYSTGQFTVLAYNNSPTNGSASASITVNLTPVGTGPHTMTLGAYSSAP